MIDNLFWDVLVNLEKENKELKELRFFKCENKQGEKCDCPVCEYERKLRKLIPDENLRRKVDFLTDSFFETLDNQNLDLAMENSKLKEEIEKLKEKK